MNKAETVEKFLRKDADLRQEHTPYFLFDINRIRDNISRYKNLKFALNYSVKSCLFEGLVREIEDMLDGFTVSSKGDLKKVRNETTKPIQFISPLIRSSEIEAVNNFGNSIIFNSLGQFHRLANSLSSHIQRFIRINPEMSFIKDKKYDPCRPYSQLGVPLSVFSEHIKKNPVKVDGIHFHNNCQSACPSDIIMTLNHIESFLGDWLSRLKYINIGGGYLYQDNFLSVVNGLRDKWNKEYQLDFLMEPGFDISNNAGFLVSSIVDIFITKEGKNIAVLDTTVNHLPEIFEYGIKPDILDHCENGYSYILTGCTCLAGDVFGEYPFKEPLNIGDTVIFKNVGSYSYVKNHTFNGIEKPNLFVKGVEHFKKHENINNKELEVINKLGDRI